MGKDQDSTLPERRPVSWAELIVHYEAIIKRYFWPLLCGLLALLLFWGAPKFGDIGIQVALLRCFVAFAALAVVSLVVVIRRGETLTHRTLEARFGVTDVKPQMWFDALRLRGPRWFFTGAITCAATDSSGSPAETGRLLDFLRKVKECWDKLRQCSSQCSDGAPSESLFAEGRTWSETPIMKETLESLHVRFYVQEGRLVFAVEVGQDMPRDKRQPLLDRVVLRLSRLKGVETISDSSQA